MSYLVLARKYRPQTFTDMIGQGHVVRTLTNAIRQDRVAHAFLFTGARGVGKTSGARLLAKSLNCEKGPTAEPCGGCAPCTEITAGTSVDVQEIDGASNNGVDQVRELRENARYLPSRDTHKIYIIDEVHMLSGAAFNALLKTLEEPPSHVKFIFATTEPHKIPVTILSRTQRFDFRRIPLNQIVGRIESILAAEKIVMSPRAAALVARQAEGSMRDALSLLDQVISAGGAKIDDGEVEEILGVIDRTEVASLAEALMKGDGAHALEIVARVFDRGLDLARLAEDLAWHLRNLLVVQIGGRAKDVLDVADHERAGLEEQAGLAGAATLSFLFDTIHAAIPEIGRAVQPRLVLEVALLKAIHMAPGVDLAELVERVEALASGLGGGGGPVRLSRGPAGRAGRGGGTSAGGGGDRRHAEPAPTEASPREEPPPPPGRFSDYAARMQARVEEKVRREVVDAPDSRDEPPPRETAQPSRASVRGAPAGAAVAAATSVAPAEPAAEPAPQLEEPPPAPQPEEPPPALQPEEPPPALQSEEPPPALQSEEPPPASRHSKPSSLRGEASNGAPSTRPTRTAIAEPVGADRRGADEGRSSGEARIPRGDDPGTPLIERFSALVHAVTEHAKRPFLAAALEHARVLSLSDEELVLALPRGLYYEGLHGAANRRTLEMLIEDHFGGPLPLRLEILDEKKLEGVPESIAALKERRLAEETEALRAEAMANPSVRLAVEALDGVIEDIRILGVEE